MINPGELHPGVVADAVADVAAADRDAVLLWLRHSAVCPTARRNVAARIMTASVYVQAGLMGLVACSRCGDRGCDWCDCGRPS